MTDWAPDDLAAVGGASEIHITTLRPDGTARSALPIWVVRVGDEVDIRSFHGSDGRWFRQAMRHPYARIRASRTEVVARLVPVGAGAPGVDEAYWTKYGRRGYGAAMTTPTASATTLRVEPTNPR
jgi:hypothetical protein